MATDETQTAFKLIISELSEKIQKNRSILKNRKMTAEARSMVESDLDILRKKRASLKESRTNGIFSEYLDEVDDIKNIIDDVFIARVGVVNPNKRAPLLDYLKKFPKNPTT